jgi:hypothetical protein
MKKAFLLTFVTLVFIGNINAKRKTFDGLIIQESDTAKVQVEILFIFKTPQFFTLHKVITILDSQGNKKNIRPNQAKEIRFNYEGETIRMVSEDYNSVTKLFLKLEIIGNLSLYKYVHHTPGPYGGHFKDVYLLKKGDNELKKVKQSNSFRKDMSEYFVDCPELAKMIENKVYGRKEIHEIVNFYNKNCK